MKPNAITIAFALLLSGLGPRAMAQDLSTELIGDYFYPFVEFSYVNNNGTMLSTYELLDGDILKETRKMLDDGKIIVLWERLYELSIESIRESITDETRLVIVSRQQVTRSIMGDSYSKDRIFLFVRPSDSGMTAWVETVNGEKYFCTAHFTDISFWRNGEKLYRKAVKISKSTRLDNGKEVKEWSYWVKGLSKLATYGFWDDPDHPTRYERSLRIDDKPIIEIDK